MGAPPVKPTPLRNSYWVLPGKVLAGEHPGGTNPQATRERLQRLIEAGVECFIDLTESGELRPYDPDLPFSIEYLRKPLKDHGTPAQRVHMAEILDCMHDAMQSGRCVYVHCRAGIGRTGTVIGCFLVERGLAGEAALDELNRLWQHCERSQSWASVPETPDQTDYILRWKRRGIFDDQGGLTTSGAQDEPAASGDTPWAHFLNDGSQPGPGGSTRDSSEASSAPSDARHPGSSRRAGTPGAAPPGAASPGTSRPAGGASRGGAKPSTRGTPPAAADLPASTSSPGPGTSRAAVANAARAAANQSNPDDLLIDPTSVANLPQPSNQRAPSWIGTHKPAGPGSATGAARSDDSRVGGTATGVGPQGGQSGRTVPGVGPKGAKPPGKGALDRATADHPDEERTGVRGRPGAPHSSAPGSAADDAHRLTDHEILHGPIDDSDPLLNDPEALAAVSTLRSRFLGALIGLAVGDAVAAATQYRRSGSFTPVGDMLGGGPFDLPRGGWSDDTSMALCLAESLLERNGFDARDQIERYRRWQQEGYLTATGQCVGITASSARAIAMAQWRRQAFFGSHDPSQQDPEPLSRVAPAVLFYFATSGEAVNQATEAARTTCQAPAVLESCRALARAMYAALSGQPKAVVLEKAVLAVTAAVSGAGPTGATPDADDGAFGGASQNRQGGTGVGRPAAGSGGAGNSGSRLSDSAGPATGGANTGGGDGQGGVTSPPPRMGSSAPAALAAAVAAFGATDNFRDAILYAANLGGDSDVVAAACGQLAGAYYGVKAIPTSWHNGLMQKELIASYADRLLAHAMVGLGE